MLYVLLVPPDMIIYWWYIFAFIARHPIFPPLHPAPKHPTPVEPIPHHSRPRLTEFAATLPVPRTRRPTGTTADCRSAPYWQGTTGHTARECDDPTISVRHVLSDLPYVLSINTHIYMRVPKLILQQRKDDLLLYAIESET